MRRVQFVGWWVLFSIMMGENALGEHWLWKGGQPQAHLFVPQYQAPFEVLVADTLNEYLADSFGWSLPSCDDADKPGLYIVAGDENSNFVIGELVLAGLKLERQDLGDEGYRLFTHEADGKQFVIVTANTQAGLKFGMQELMYFHIVATASGAEVEWPLDITRRPVVSYRGSLVPSGKMTGDSLESWKRALKFNSELTVNRNWFWLSGFPLLAQYGGEYASSDLARLVNVQGLVTLCRARAMKFCMAGGWLTGEHEKMAGGSIERGIRWYVDLVRALPEAESVYLRVDSEGKELDEKTWQDHVEGLGTLVDLVRRDRPGLEFVLDLGQFESKVQRDAIPLLEFERSTFLRYGYGDLQLSEKAPAVSLLRWYVPVSVEDDSGPIALRSRGGEPFVGVVNRFDPTTGQSGKGQSHDPHAMPFFSQAYRFRERCWDPSMTPEQFVGRMRRRLFDADAPAEAIQYYLKLADICMENRGTTDEVAPIASFVKTFAGKGSSRQRDTLAQMGDALAHIPSRK